MSSDILLWPTNFSKQSDHTMSSEKQTVSTMQCFLVELVLSYYQQDVSNSANLSWRPNDFPHPTASEWVTYFLKGSVIALFVHDQQEVSHKTTFSKRTFWSHPFVWPPASEWYYMLSIVCHLCIYLLSSTVCGWHTHIY